MLEAGKAAASGFELKGGWQSRSKGPADPEGSGYSTLTPRLWVAKQRVASAALRSAHGNVSKAAQLPPPSTCCC